MENLYNKRLKKAFFAARLISSLVFVRMICLTGSMETGKVNYDSDIDFFIVAKQERIWTTRFFVVLILKLFFLYRNGNLPRQTAGKICPNRYLADKYLIVNPQNLYHAREYSQLIILFNQNNTFEKYKAKNSWIKKFNCDFKNSVNTQFYFEKSKLNLLKNFFENILNYKFGNRLEKFLRKKQLNKINRDPRTYKKGSGVVVNDNELRFHPNPK